MTTAHRQWKKSSFSANEGNCVELPHTLDAVRDSKQRGGPVLPARELPEFIRQVKAGRFDH